MSLRRSATFPTAVATASVTWEGCEAAKARLGYKLRSSTCTSAGHRFEKNSIQNERSPRRPLERREMGSQNDSMRSVAVSKEASVEPRGEKSKEKTSSSAESVRVR